MKQWAEEACDAIDAGFFSGDSFQNEEAIKRIEWYIARWQREIVEIKKELQSDPTPQ